MRNLITVFIATFLILSSLSCNKDEIESIIHGEDLTDIDGNNYQSIIIGTQQWMAQNLMTTKYNDGEQIPLINTDTGWRKHRYHAYCWVDDSYNCSLNEKYGAMYNWFVIKTGKLCPTGWHVPTDDEWEELELYIYNEFNEDYGVGTHLKAKYGWDYDNVIPSGNNYYGFSALAAGERNNDSGKFVNNHKFGRWWSSTKEDSFHSWSRSLSFHSTGMYRGYSNQSSGFSVRCIKD